MLVSSRLMRPRLRPCTRGLALFLGDQALEPKLTLTTLCALPLGRTGGGERGRRWGGERKKRRKGYVEGGREEERRGDKAGEEEGQKAGEMGRD